MQISLNDIAKQAGCSLSTVSRIINNHPSVKADTAARVREVIASSGYRKDQDAFRLAQRRWSSKEKSLLVIAYVWSYHTEAIASRLRHTAIMREYEGIVAEADSRGMKIEQYFLGPEVDSSRLAKKLYNRRVSGVIFAPGAMAGFKAGDWKWAVCLYRGYALREWKISRFSLDRLQMTKLAVKIASERGKRRIAMVMYHVPNLPYRESTAGPVLTYHWTQNTPAPYDFIYRIGFEREPLLDWFHRINPDVILGDDCVVYDILTAEKIRIPDEVSYINLESLYTPASVDLTSVEPDHRETGRNALRLLMENMRLGLRGEPVFPIHHKINGFWHEGATF